MVFTDFSATARILMSGIAARLRGDQLCHNYHSAVGAAVFTGGEGQQLIPILRVYAGIIEGQRLALADN